MDELERPVSHGTPADVHHAVVHRTVCANGLTVLSERIPGRRSVAVGTWVRFGSVHDSREHMGLAHLLEHMVFKGTARRSAKEIALALETRGGSLDAYTEAEFTSYHARVLDRDLPIALDVIGDLVFHPTLRHEDLTLERQVILEEIAMVEDTPDDLIFELHHEALWGTHPHAHRILGVPDTVSSISVDTLRAARAERYQPANMVVVATGNIAHEQLLHELERAGWLAEVPHDAPVRAVPSVAPAEPLAPTRVHRARKDIGQVHVVLGAPGLAHGAPERHAFALLGLLIGGGMSSRLFQRVREEFGYAYSVHHFANAHADIGVHGVYLASAPASAQQALDSAREILADVAARGLSEMDIAAGKAQMAGQLLLSLESPSARMYRAALSELYHDPLRTPHEMLAEIEAIDARTVADVAQRLFDPSRMTVVSHGPKAVR